MEQTRGESRNLEKQTYDKGAHNIMNKKYFTLVELMVVAIMVAILAAVAIPLMTGNVKRAIATEAEAALGTIRSNMRAIYAETRDYTNDGRGNTISATTDVIDLPGFQEGDLDGRYFSDECYSIRSVSSDAYVIECNGALSTASEADKVDGEASGTPAVITGAIVITIDQDGELTREEGL